MANWLARAIRKVAWVSYPGLPGDRYHNLAKKYVPKGAGAVFTFGLKGGYDAGVKLVSNVEAVLASRQYRRHPLADHPPGLDHAPPAHRRAEGRRPAPAPTWCGCRSGWRTRTTSSPTSSRRWTRRRRRIGIHLQILQAPGLTAGSFHVDRSVSRFRGARPRRQHQCHHHEQRPDPSALMFSPPPRRAAAFRSSVTTPRR